MLKADVKPSGDHCYGFEADEQTMGISEPVKLAVQKPHEWSMPVCMAQGWLHKAFKSLDHHGFEDSLFICQYEFNMQPSKRCIELSPPSPL